MYLRYTYISTFDIAVHLSLYSPSNAEIFTSHDCLNIAGNEDIVQEYYAAAATEDRRYTAANKSHGRAAVTLLQRV